MKSRIPILILSLAVAVSAISLGACSKSETGDTSEDEISTVGNDNSTSENSTESDPEPELSDDVKRLIEEYPCVLEFTKDDGTVLSPSDITSVQFPTEENIKNNYLVSKVTYGFGYMTYGLPVFATTLDNDDWKSEGDGFSNAIDWVIYRRDEAEKLSDNYVRFEVRPGDKLENGLVVKSAETVYTAQLPEDLEEWGNDSNAPEYNPFSSCKIEFDGTLTLEGVLYKYAYDETYNAAPNDVFFYPDTTKNEFVPMWQNMMPQVALFDSDTTIIYEDLYYLGNLDSANDWLPSVDYDVDEVFGDKNYVRVRITLKDICVGSLDKSTQSAQRAKIADVELID